MHKNLDPVDVGEDVTLVFVGIMVLLLIIDLSVVDATVVDLGMLEVAEDDVSDVTGIIEMPRQDPKASSLRSPLVFSIKLWKHCC